MSKGDLTVQVLNLSPRASVEELTTFFSYCGTVHKIQILRDKDQVPYALVTFGQPYAFQTALLLDDAIFCGQPIYTIPAYAMKIPVVSDEETDQMTQIKSQGFIPAANTLTRSKEELIKENLKLSVSGKGRVLMKQARSAISAVEQAAERMGTAIMNNNYISTGATRLSDVLDKASSSASQLGIKKRNN